MFGKKYQLDELEIEAPESISCKYFLTHREETKKMDILIVSFFGDYPDGSLGNKHGSYISSMTISGIASFDPECIILDLRELNYNWGNTLLKVFQEISDYKDTVECELPFPVLVVTSAKSKNGFLSLVTPSNGKEPDFHYTNINKAIKKGIKLAELWLDA